MPEDPRPSGTEPTSAAERRDSDGGGAARPGIEQDQQIESHVAALRLLWEGKERPQRGPRPKLDLDDIVQAAIAVADAEGLDAVSMRRVAKELGMGTMSLYRYVPGKDGLLDLMFDAVCGEGTLLHEVPGDWRAKFEHSARESWDVYRRHPWMLQVSSTRPTLGPNVMNAYESQLQALTDIGLTAKEMVAITNLVDSYVSGVAQSAVVAAMTERESGLTDEQWWTAVDPVLTEVVDWERFPVNAWVAAEGAYEDAGEQPFSQFSFDFGLQRLLDGIEALLATRRGGSLGEGSLGQGS
jgi:AcrR family transcriptional regulator